MQIDQHILDHHGRSGSHDLVNRFMDRNHSIDADEMEILSFRAAWDFDGDPVTARLLSQPSDALARRVAFLDPCMASKIQEAKGDDTSHQSLIAEIHRVACGMTEVRLLVVHYAESLDDEPECEANGRPARRWWVYHQGLLPWMGELHRALRRWLDEETDLATRALATLIERLTESGPERSVLGFIKMMLAALPKVPEAPPTQWQDHRPIMRYVLASGGQTSIFTPLA